MVDEKTTAFAERLRTLREAAGLSQYALARKSGLSKQAVSRLELGESEPTWATVQLLAAALGVEVGAFADPTVQPPPEQPSRPKGRPRKAEGPAAGPKGKGKGRGNK